MYYAVEIKLICNIVVFNSVYIGNNLAAALSLGEDREKNVFFIKPGKSNKRGCACNTLFTKDVFVGGISVYNGCLIKFLG
jgi:hypothetical protein